MLVVHHSFVHLVGKVLLEVNHCEFFLYGCYTGGAVHIVARNLIEAYGSGCFFCVDFEFRGHGSVNEHLVGPLDAFVLSEFAVQAFAFSRSGNTEFRYSVVGEFHEVEVAVGLSIVSHIAVVVGSFLVKFHQLVTVGIHAVLVRVVNHERVGAHGRGAFGRGSFVAKGYGQFVVVTTFTQSSFILCEFRRELALITGCHNTVVTTDRSERIVGSIVASNSPAADGHAFGHSHCGLIATLRVGIAFFHILCCNTCRTIGASGVDFRFCGRIVVLVEEFESLKVSRFFKEEVTVCAFFSAHTVGLFGVDGRAGDIA